MAAQSFSHEKLTIKLCIQSTAVCKSEVTIDYSMTDDWDENLSSLLSKITNEFKFLSEMEELEWSISINDKVVDKTNVQQFRGILSSTPPIPVIEIFKMVK